MSNAAANVVLSARGASKSFGSLRAVHDVSFDVYEGEIFGIAGPNGAGKTTLFNLITGIPFHADTGAIEFRGQPITKLPPHKIFKAGIARTFQKEAAFDSLSVTENVRLAAAFGGSGSRRSRASDVREALDALELAEFADRRAGTLPLYAKKRLMLASALVEKPALIMLDEPGAGLNSVELDQFMQLVRRLNAAGLTVIVIEHVLGLLFGISHRLMIMDSGRKIAEGQPEVIARDDAVIEAYLGERGKNAFHALKG
ncbi:MAG TPA: ABC transporter ATP-binding protein [Gaiellaceae bacterium]|jgi:ABC-type branched-subunit amino acid transport system ATPase component|nr:ABC transporter ATP-binding protein [Gaiellaceae bacterium]